jgi:large subunit ribosomal protein L20
MRVKRGKVKNAKHKKVLAATKGYRLSYSKLYKRAKEAILHASKYSFAHRRKRQSQFRNVWIRRINAGLTESDMKYSVFINSLKKKDIALDRKVLAGLALDYPETFKKVVEAAK